MKIWFTVLLMVLLDSTSSLCLSGAMKQVGNPASRQLQVILEFAKRALTNPLIWLGILFQAGTFLLLLTLFSWADLSVVVPMASIGYIVSALGARFVLKENITRLRWLGTAFIGIGVALISRH
jgi:drug/metabolite transporter (DMT)-like permease